MSDDYILAMADQEKAQASGIFDSMIECWGDEFPISELMESSNFAHEQLKLHKDPRRMLFYTATIAGAAHLIQRALEAKQKGKKG
jgi:hypothetical protein